ncbi:MAG: hypothetical protein AAF959_22125 [Cyanobacteria bacterium P01_D01_bin.56]
MIFNFFKNKDTQALPDKAQSTEELWNEVSTEKEETMKGGYPWPGFPPPGVGGRRGVDVRMTK